MHARVLVRAASPLKNTFYSLSNRVLLARLKKEAGAVRKAWMRETAPGRGG